jgi:Domain of unknown function, B. Theta Gene description (DUF3875)
MVMERKLNDILPILGVEHDSILSKQGDITIAYQVTLPEIFSLSNEDYEAFHQAWIKAIRILVKHSVFHKQDWFLDKKHEPDFTGQDSSFLSLSNERFFNERPFLQHLWYILLRGFYKPWRRVFQGIQNRSIAGGVPYLYDRGNGENEGADVCKKVWGRY